MKTITLIGLGWLGMPLAQALRLAGFQVKGSKTELHGVQAARLSGIATYQLKFTPEPECEYAVMDELLATDALIITLPVSRSAEAGNAYLQAIQILVDSALAYGQVQRIVFTSSTSVYGDHTGPCTEETVLQPVSSAGKTLLKVEQWLHALPHVAVDILRLAGLVGAGRHPGRFLAGRQGVPLGRQGVNLVHQTDVINAIKLVLTTALGGQIFNLCAQQHPPRGEYYPAVARALGLTPPEFIDQSGASQKLIDGSAICRTLGFRYQYTDPYQMIK